MIAQLQTIFLPPALQDKVSEMPETGMGYHTVTLTMKDGTRHFLVHVLNGTHFRSRIPIDSDNIKDVALCARL